MGVFTAKLDYTTTATIPNVECVVRRVIATVVEGAKNEDRQIVEGLWTFAVLAII